MKKILILFTLLVMSACTKPYRINPQIYENEIKAGYQVVYSPGAKEWNNGGMTPDRIVFTKSISSGSGNYSEYKAKGYPLIMMPTQFEFLWNGRLIGYSTADLKFYELVYEDEIFRIKVLSFAQVKEIFPGLEILKLSSVKTDLIVKRLPFEPKSFMMLNDTDRSFYHYSFEEDVKFDAPFNALLTVKTYETLIFSHFGSRDVLYPILKIIVTY